MATQTAATAAAAAKKAGKTRILAAMREAARIAARAQASDPGGGTWARGYVHGAGRYCPATVRACLMTAWGA